MVLEGVIFFFSIFTAFSCFGVYWFIKFVIFIVYKTSVGCCLMGFVHSPCLPCIITFLHMFWAAIQYIKQIWNQNWFAFLMLAASVLAKGAMFFFDL